MLSAELKTLVKLAVNHRGRRAVLTREYFFRAARRFTPVLAAQDGDLRFFVSTGDDVIGRVTFAHGGFDAAAMTRVVAEVAARTGVAEPLRGRAVLDVGGNIGTTSIYAIRRHGAARAVAFEPAPSNLELLRQNTLVNGLSDAVQIVPVAVSDQDGTVTFEISPENSGDHRVRVGPSPSGCDAMGEERRSTIDVPARRLDAMVADGTIAMEDVAMLWIDVQGHEAHVLDGARETLARGIPTTVEYWPYGLERAGGLARFHALVGERFATVVDMGPPFLDQAPRELPASAVASLAARYPGINGFTDVLLLP